MLTENVAGNAGLGPGAQLEIAGDLGCYSPLH